MNAILPSVAVLLVIAAEPAGVRVTLDDKPATLARHLTSLRKFAVVDVVDDRGVADEPFAVAVSDRSFWDALHAIADKAGAKVVLPAGRGPIRLARRAPGDEPVPTSTDRDVRFRVVKVTADRDLETGRGGTTLTLEAAWVPTLRPLFVDSLAQSLKVTDAAGKAVEVAAEGSSLVAADGRTSMKIDVALPGFPRADRKIGTVTGRVNAVVPTEFLAFRFDDDLAGLNAAVPGGAVRRKELAGVTCRVDRLTLGGDRWSVQVSLEYPEGGKELESFQATALVVQNQMALVHNESKRLLTASAYNIEAVSGRKATVTYHFTDKPTVKRGKPDGWRVRYEAPAKIVEASYAFSFKDVPLP